MFYYFLILLCNHQHFLLMNNLMDMSSFLPAKTGITNRLHSCLISNSSRLTILRVCFAMKFQHSQNDFHVVKSPQLPFNNRFKNSTYFLSVNINPNQFNEPKYFLISFVLLTTQRSVCKNT